MYLAPLRTRHCAEVPCNPQRPVEQDCSSCFTGLGAAPRAPVPCPGHGREAHGFACICHSLTQCSQLSGGEELVWEQRQLSREPGSCQELRPGPRWWRGEDWDKERDGERGHGSEGRVGTGGCLPYTSPSLGLTVPISVQGRHFGGSYVLLKE